MLWLLPILFLWKPLDPTWQANWVERWGVIALSLGLQWVWKRFRVSWLGVFLAYYLVMAVVSVYLGGYHTAPNLMDKPFVLMLRSASQDHIIQLFAFLAFMELDIKLERGLFWLAWVLMAGILCSKLPTNQTLFIANPSMAATCVVLLSGVHPLALIAILATHSYTAFLAFAAGTAWRFRRHIPIRGTVYLFTIITGFFAWWIVFLKYLPHLPKIPDNGRLWMWNTAYLWFQTQSWLRWMIGMGPGTGRVWLPYSQFIHPEYGQVFVAVWLHNDYLQTILELGIIGVVLSLLASRSIYRHAEERHKITLIAFSVAALTNFPTHWAYSALVLWMITQASTKSKEQAPKATLRSSLLGNQIIDKYLSFTGR